MISIIIPTLNGACYLRALMNSLRRQTMKDVEVIVVDSESADGTADLAVSLGCIVQRIARVEFDHGGTRNFAVDMSSGDFLVFLTQDALPVSEKFLARLIAPIDGRVTAAAYARQIADPKATPTEVFARLYNYPPESSMRHISRVERRSLKAFFFSNTASAISRHCFEKVGRFPSPVATNEDMLLCARLMDTGYQIAYVAEAEVTHSHEFTPAELFRRYFRIGTVAREYQGMLRVERNAKEGLDFVRRQIAHLQRIGRPELIPGAVVEAGLKALAFYCGHVWRSRSRTADTQHPAASSARVT
jgi:rhamnosyltransferase